MKIKKIFVMTTVVLMASLIMLTLPANAATFPSLPTGTVFLTLGSPIGAGNWPRTVTFTGISGQAGGPFDVSDGTTYTAWCDQFYLSISPGVSYPTILQSSLGLPTPWDKINYLLNHNTGEDMDEQAAMWLLCGVLTADITARYPGQPSADAIAMYGDANTNGGGFIPGPGQLVAVNCSPEAGEQDLLIQLRIPGTGPGLTPGFWKHNVGVYLDLKNGAYSDPTGSTLVSKDTMGTWLHAHWTDAQLLDLFNAMSTIGGGAAGAATRNNAANVFNAAAGLAPL